MKRVIWVNGPEPTGSGFRKVAGFATFDQMCCGRTATRFRFAAMNCESGVFRLITTPNWPFAFTEARFVPGR